MSTYNIENLEQNLTEIGLIIRKVDRRPNFYIINTPDGTDTNRSTLEIFPPTIYDQNYIFYFDEVPLQYGQLFNTEKQLIHFIQFKSKYLSYIHCYLQLQYTMKKYSDVGEHDTN